MLKNYFKIAIAVLRRKKFFTFISLFGISFTLAILIVLAAFIDQVIGNDYPDRKRDRSLYITALEQRMDKPGYHTGSGGPLSFYFLNHFAGGLKTPVKVAIASKMSATNAYVNNKKIKVYLKYTNAAWWEVLENEFLEGKPYTQQQIDNADPVAVITEDAKRAYFGDEPLVVGKYIEADNTRFRVIGVIKNISLLSGMMYGDLYVPYTLSKTDYKYKYYNGDYQGILLAGSKAEVPKMKEEYEQMVARLPVESKDFDKVYSHGDSYFASLMNFGHEDTPGMTYMLTAIGIFVALILLLPTLNLVNINITRIMERSSEIGVRKAFGASSATLVYQFLVENCILTLLGGFIGGILSVVVMKIFNSAHLIANMELSLNFTVLFVALLTCFVFGLLSGVYPAWRMSRLDVVTALKA